MMEIREMVSSSLKMFVHSYVVISLLTALSAADQCVQQSNCICKTSTRTIDLTRYSSATGNPRFASPLIQGSQYFYNPCKEVSKTGPPPAKPVTADVIQVQNSVYYALGQDNTAKFAGDPDAGTLTLTYTSTTRTTLIFLVCGNNELKYDKEGPKLTYQLTLGIQELCSANGGISTGTILVILFFVFLAVYLIAGLLFLKYVRKAEGVEIVPNYEFWKALPGLIRDGCYFTCRGCKTEATYEKI